MSEALTKLFNEKRLNKPIVEAVVPKPKKIKKKDMIVLDIQERELKYYEYETIQDIKIYNGILIEGKASTLENIKFFEQITTHDLFTPLHPSTLTARGEFSNITFSEEDFIKTLGIPPIEFAPILKIGCNWGELYRFPNPYINHLIFDMVRSIEALNDKNISIGCSCQELLDTAKVLELNKVILRDMDGFAKLFKKCIKEKIICDKILIRKKITKILKNFTHIQNFIILSDDEVKEIYTIMDTYITNPVELQYCNDYIDNIVKLITIFTDYEKACTCSKKYALENCISVDKNALVKKIKSSARGRKPKKKNTKRKIQGTGKYFSSQISFEVYNMHNNKITKVKIFRNGCYQIPGVKRPNMSDLVDSITLLKTYLNSISLDLDKVVDIPYIISVMRNYTCRIVDTNITIILTKLEDILYFEKNMKLTSAPFDNYLQFLGKLQLSDKAKFNVLKYCNVGFYQISEISLNGERYPGLLVKFLRSIPNKKNKKLTIKVLSSGKINIDGATSELEVYEVYYWFQYIFAKYWDEITYDSSKKIEEIISSDSESGYESLYDL